MKALKSWRKSTFQDTGALGQRKEGEIRSGTFQKITCWFFFSGSKEKNGLETNSTLKTWPPFTAFLRLLVAFRIHSQPKLKPTTLFLNFSNILGIKKISPHSSAKHRGTHLLVNKMFNVLLSA